MSNKVDKSPVVSTSVRSLAAAIGVKELDVSIAKMAFVQGMKREQISTALGLSFRNVQARLHTFAQFHKAADMPPVDAVDVLMGRHDDDLEYTPPAERYRKRLQAQAQAIARLHESLNKRQVVIDNVVAALVAELGTYDPSPYTPIPMEGRKGRPEYAMLELSDWQFGSNWTGEDVAGLNEMSTTILEQRVELLTQRVLHLIDLQRSAVNIPWLVINALGDFIENEIIWESQGTYIDMNASDQMMACLESMEKMLLTLLRHGSFEEIRMYCFPAGTPVLMGDLKQKPIEDVSVGDEVITHTGARRKVTRTGSRIAGSVVSIEAEGLPKAINATPEHPFFAIKGDGVVCARYPSFQKMGRRCWLQERDVEHHPCCSCNSRPNPKAEWVKAADLVEGDYLLVPTTSGLVDNPAPIGPDHDAFSGCVVRRYGERFSVSNSERAAMQERMGEVKSMLPFEFSPRNMRILGLWVAEGSVGGPTEGQPNSLSFSFGAHEAETLARDVVEWARDMGVSNEDIRQNLQNENKSALVVTLNNTMLARLFVYLAGKGAAEKSLHSSLLMMDPSLQRELLMGMCDGDGTRYEKGACRGAHLRYYTVSSSLAEDARRLALRCGFLTSTQVSERGDGRLPQHSVCLSHPDIPGSGDGNAGRTKRWGGYIALPIRQITAETAETVVYNLEVEIDHSYVAGDAAVHNCVAGNHGRMGKKPNSMHWKNNWDFLLYRFLARRFKNEPRVKFIIGTSPWLAYRLPQAPRWNHVILHGDTIPNNLGIPYYGINREVAKMATLTNMPVHLVHLGHFHQPSILDNTYGAKIINGCLTGASPFSVGKLLMGGLPQQLLFGIHPEHGRTWNYPVLLANMPEVTADDEGVYSSYVEE